MKLRIHVIMMRIRLKIDPVPAREYFITFCSVSDHGVKTFNRQLFERHLYLTQS